jgi:hypothetical protein
MATKIKCLFGLHNKKIVNVYHFTDISFSQNGIPATKVTTICKDCSKIFTQTIYGTYKRFTKEELE